MEQTASLGALLRSLRKERGWSQRRLSAEAGVSPQFLSDIERSYEHPANGPVRPSDETINALASALNVPAVRLHAALGRLDADGPELQRAQQRFAQDQELEEQGQWVARYRDLSQRDQRIVKTLIEQLDADEI